MHFNAVLGKGHGRKRVARLMRAAGLAGKSPRRWRATTIADPNAGKRPDLVRRDFSTDPAAADTSWCGGCQYTSAQHARLAAAHGIRLSVGRRGQCWDNAVAESFFSTIKTELLHRQPWPTAPPPAKPYSSTSKAGTTPDVDTPASAISAPPRSKLLVAPIDDRSGNLTKINTSTLSVESGQAQSPRRR